MPLQIRGYGKYLLMKEAVRALKQGYEYFNQFKERLRARSSCIARLVVGMKRSFALETIFEIIPRQR